MARSEARMQFGIWRGLDVVSAHARLMYAVLLTEPTVNHAGVGAIRRNLWARNAALTAAEAEKALQELVEGSYILLDDDTEEVLVRTLIRNDGVWKQPYMLKGAIQSALQAVSPAIRRMLAGELRKLPPKQPDRVSKSGKTVTYPDPHAAADVLDPPGPTDPHVKPSGDPSERVSKPSPEGPAEKGFERVHGGGGGRGRGLPPVGNYSPSKEKNTRATRASDRDTPDGFNDFWDAYPRKTAKLAAVKAYRAALKRGVPPDRLAAEARRYARLMAGSETRFVAHPSTWLNQGRYDDEPEPARPQLRAVSGGYEPYRNPVDPSVYDEPLLPIPQEPQ